MLRNKAYRRKIWSRFQKFGRTSWRSWILNFCKLTYLYLCINKVPFPFNNVKFKAPLSGKDNFPVHYTKIPIINLSKLLGQEHISTFVTPRKAKAKLLHTVAINQIRSLLHTSSVLFDVTYFYSFYSKYSSLVFGFFIVNKWILNYISNCNEI